LFSIYYFGEIDSVTIFCFITVVLFAFFSLKKNNSIFIKMQPVLLSAVIGIFLVVSYFIERPLLLIIADKYQSFFPENMIVRLKDSHFRLILEKVTLTFGIAHFFHSFVVLFAAFKLSNWWWIAIRGIGYYLFLFLGLFSVRLLL
jgi:intracellular septation protein A